VELHRTWSFRSNHSDIFITFHDSLDSRKREIVAGLPSASLHCMRLLFVFLSPKLCQRCFHIHIVGAILAQMLNSAEIIIICRGSTLACTVRFV
jgi:hypothetical protein